MAVAYVGQAIAVAGANTTISFTYTSGSGSDRLLIAGGKAPSESISSVSYAGAALTSGATAVARAGIFYKAGQATGGNTLSFVLSGYDTFLYSVADFTGADQTTPVGTGVTASGTGTAVSTGSVTVPTDGMSWGFGHHAYASVNMTIVSGTLTCAASGTGGRRIAGAYSASTGALAWTANASYAWEALALPINAVAGADAILTAAQGSLALTGQAASLKVARVLSAAQGSYSLTGQNAALTYEQPGVYTLTAVAGSYTITGSDGLAQRAMNAAFGSYSLSGQDAGFTLTTPQDYTLIAAQGNYTLSGKSARLQWSGEPPVIPRSFGIVMGIRMGL